METKTQTKTKKRTSTSTRKKVSFEDIQVKAQEVYQNRVSNGQQGDQLSDWLEAEKSLTSKK